MTGARRSDAALNAASQGSADRRERHSVEDDRGRDLRRARAALGIRADARHGLARRPRRWRGVNGVRTVHNNLLVSRDAPPDAVDSAPMPGPLARNPCPRSDARARGPVGGAEPRRPRRRGDQDRAAEERRRLARLRPAVAQGRAGPRHRRIGVLRLRQPRQEIAHAGSSRRPEGQEIVRELAAKCDVLLENFKYGDLDRYGLGYDAARKIEPRPYLLLGDRLRTYRSVARAARATTS